METELKSDDVNKHEANKNMEVIKSLENDYRKALAAFKADKSNKDLRRLKSAAKQAWDQQVALSQDGKPLTCRNCSQQFIFTIDEQNHFAKMGWDSIPTKCSKCVNSEKEKRTDRSHRDSKTKNMCYAYQRGICKYGNKCKFSHDPRGKKKDDNPMNNENDDEEGRKIVTSIAKCKWGKRCTIKKCRYSHDDCEDEAVAKSSEGASYNARGSKQKVRKAMLKSLKKAPNKELKMKDLRKLVRSHMKEKNEDLSKIELKMTICSVLESNDNSNLVLDGKIVKLLST